MKMKVERNRDGNKYTFIPEDEKDGMFLDRIGKLEEENKKLKEIMRDVLYRTTKHNIKNVVYKGEKIEIGNGDYDYTLD